MSGKTYLRSIVALALLAVTILLLSAAGPLAAETDAFSLTVNVNPAGSGSVGVNPPGPYDLNDVVTLTASPAAGYVFDKWVLAGDNKWWDAGWDYRVELTAGAAGYARKDKPAEFAINFTQLWTSLGASGVLDTNSIRVVEVDANDNVIDESVPFQFDKAIDFNAATKAAGTLVVMMEGNTSAGASRSYHVYFDVTGKGFSAPSFPAQVVLTDGVMDEAIPSYRIVTPTSTYFLHKPSGGLSSLNDANGNDWISWNTATGALGANRGIPNAAGGSNDGLFHPGKGKMTSTIRSTGPIKATVHVIESKAPGRTKWEGMFEFYPNYTTFTMINASVSDALAYPFWFVYEGTPGGQLNPTTDFVVFSNGEQITTGQTRNGDLPNEEWAFVADPSVGAAGRSIFFINHADDTKNDTYFPDGSKVMTVLGFGRTNAQPLLDNNSTPREFTFGLMDETLIDNAKPIIYNAYRTLNATVGGAEARGGASLGSQNPLQYTITGNHTITALFKSAQFTVTTSVSPAGTGTVTKSPDKATYNNGELVTLTATATAAGFNFAGWQGDVTGTNNPITVPVTKNMVVTALFAESFTVTTSANPVEGGTVTVSPAQQTYPPGTEITVTATPNSGYTFTGWSGDLSGTQSPLTTTVNSNLTIVANFATTQTYTVNVTVPGGGGTVSKFPEGPDYPAGSVVALTALPDTGKRFVGWGGDISGTELIKEVTVTGNLNITAEFADDTYPLNVTVSPPEGGAVAKSPNQPLYAPGTIVTLTAVPSTGWTFVGWTGNVTEIDPTTATITIQAGANDVTATFTAPGPYTLTVSTSGNGVGAVTINPVKTEYAFGEIVKLTAVPGTDSLFGGWAGDAAGTKNPINITMDGDKNVIANFIMPSGPFSDPFNSCSLSPRWGQLVNPLGDGSVKVNGSQLHITVPGGPSHNVWSDVNNAPRVMQTADNIDFEYVIKFDSQVTQTAQMQGLIIEQDPQNFARFDFEFNETIKAYAATFANGVARKRFSIDINPSDAVYMKIARVANTWTMSFSGNGTDWQEAGTIKNYVLDVAKAGIFAGNVAVKNAPAPAHTAIVDFFQNTAQGPLGEDLPLLTLDTEGNGSVTTDPPLSQLACGQTVTLTAQPGAGATFTGWSGDVSGTQSSVSLLLTGPKTVKATFTGSRVFQLFLPSIIR